MEQTSELFKSTPIQEFYRNATIFITGGTGFVGKILVYKLLKTFQLNKIYILIRVKDNLCVNERLDNFFKESIFDNIRNSNQKLFDKVHPISANFNAIDLDISDSDRGILYDEVEIVFNVVASVKFNEKLSDAIGINVLGTKKILNLVMKMKRLKSFMHISTLYSNCNRKVIEEKVYESEIGYEKVIQLTRILNDHDLEKLRHCLIGDMPNTYTMTKRCAENLVNHKAYFLPAGIFRPPIVLSTYKDPFPGWTDNLYGPSGLCTWAARGVVHSIRGSSNNKANLIPVDYCVNAMIASAWDISRRYESRANNRTEIPVYNYIFDKNNLTWGEYMHLSRKGYHEPFDKGLWCFSYFIVPSKKLHRLTTILFHSIPGYILDLIAVVNGQKKIYSKGYKKMGKVIEMMSYFGLREWKFDNSNMLNLHSNLIEEDKSMLEFNINTINWKEYFHNYLSGIRKYFYKDSDEKLENRKKIYRRFLLAHICLKSTFGLLLILSFTKIIFKILFPLRKLFK